MNGSPGFFGIFLQNEEGLIKEPQNPEKITRVFPGISST